MRLIPERELKEVQKIATVSNNNVLRLQGAINYIDTCIKRIKTEEEAK